MPRTRMQVEASEAHRDAGSCRPHDTPTKARIRQAVADLDRYGPQPSARSKAHIFQRFGVSRSSGYSIIADESDRRGPNQIARELRPGRPSAITPLQIHKCERLITSYGAVGRSLTWEQLLHEAEINASEETLRRAMGQRDWSRCIACRRGWQSPKNMTKRVEFAERMLLQYPYKYQWDNVRSSDEVHFGFGPAGRLYVTRRPGERYCEDCTQFADPPQEKDKNKLHAWGAIGVGFKSELVLYDIKSNRNGKMNAQYYRDEILEKHVKPWLQTADFVLEEDRDSAHGIPVDKDGVVQRWKAQNNLQFYFNCTGSPDLAPIENAWGPLKSDLRTYPHWDLQEMREIVLDSWHHHLQQRSIDKWCRSLPDRLEQVIDLCGKMTPN